MLQRLRPEELAKLPGQFGVTYYTWDEKNRCTYYVWDGKGFILSNPDTLSPLVTAAELKTAIETLNPAQISDSGAGRGRMVRLPSRELTLGKVNLSTMQSIEGAGQATTTVRLDHAGLAAGDHTHLTVLADSISKQGNRPQGKISSITFDGNKQRIEADIADGSRPIVTAYKAVDTKRVHILEDVVFSNYTGDGVVFETGSDQSIVRRARVEGVNGIAWIARGSDQKWDHIAGNGRGGAFLIENSAPEVDIFDFWVPADTPLAVYTGTIMKGVGVRMAKGTIAGPLLIKGKNANGNVATHYGNSYHSFVQVKFKHDKERVGSGALQHYLRVEDAELVQLVAPWFDFEAATPVDDLPEYLISIGTSTGTAAQAGSVSIVGGAHLMEAGRAGATGGAMTPRIGAKKGICDNPKSLQINGKPFGAVDIVPAWAVSSPSPSLRTHVQVSTPGTARTVAKADFPLAYLAATVDKGIGGVGIAGTHGRLDDGATTAPLPELPVISSDYVYALPARL